MSEILRFVSWSAVSSEEQAKKTSLEHQHATNLKVIEKLGGQLIKKLTVKGVSRDIVLLEDACRTPGLEAYAELYEMIKYKAFDVLVFLDLGRLGRTAPLILAVVELCRRAGILCYETDAPPTSLNVAAMASYDEMLIRAIKAVGMQQEVIKIKKRLKDGRRDSIALGAFPGRVPYGWLARYAPDGTKSISIDEDAAYLVRLILIDLYLDRGYGSPLIREEMLKRGYLTPEGSNAWLPGTFHSMLKMVWRYAGYTELDGKRIKGNWEPIITEEEAQRVETEFNRRGKSKRSISRPHLFTGIIWCPVCNTPLRTANVNANQKNVVSVYHYMACRGPHKIHRIQISAIRAGLTKYLETTGADIEEILEASNGADYGTQLAKLEAEEARLKKQINRIDDDYYLNETITMERHRTLIKNVENKLDRIDQQRKQVQAAQAQTKSGEDATRRKRELFEQGIERLSDSDARAANAWLRQRVRIYVLEGAVVEIRHL